MKDVFSDQSHEYARFRPSYPKEIVSFLLSLVPERKKAWDCGTGNGQLAVELAAHFQEVFATDISSNQIKNAFRKNNIVYSVERAERTSFPDREFDLITAAQAVHWFEFTEFYAEVRRTLKPKGVIAMIGYSLPRIDPGVDTIMNNFYANIVGAYWDEERKYVDERYQTIPFPFKEIPAPTLSAAHMWNLDQLVGFINSWSAVQHFKERNNENPVDRIVDDLSASWENEERKKVTFPLFMRVGMKG